MKQMNLLAITLFLVALTFSSCSKTPQDPYFDRAKTASQKAQEQLNRD